MPEDEVGWIKVAREFFEKYRGISMDKVIEQKRNLLSMFFASRIGNYLWMIIAAVIFHLKLLYAITSPLHGFLTKGVRSTVYTDGEIRMPRFSFYKITLVLFALSVIWHCFSWPNPMSALKWNFSIRPQVNLKPQMSLIAKSRSEPAIPSSQCSEQPNALRSQSETAQCKIDAKVDLGIGVRLRNAVLDPILNAYDTVTESLSLASEFAASMLGSSRSKLSVASDDECSYISATDNVGDGYQNEEAERKRNAVDDKIKCDERKSMDENEKTKDKLTVGPYRWFNWKLPEIRMNNFD